MEIIDLIRYGLIGHMLITVTSAVLFAFALKRPQKANYEKLKNKDDDETKANNAREYDRFESDKYIWRQKIKATGALTAILVTLFSIWSIIALNIENRENSKNQSSPQTSEDKADSQSPRDDDVDSAGSETGNN